MPPGKAQVSIFANPNPLAVGLAIAQRMVVGFAKNAKNALAQLSLAPMPAQRHHGRATMAARAAQGVVNSAVGRGVDTLIDQGKKVFEFNEEILRFGISARKSKAELQGIADAGRAISNQMGVDALDVIRMGRAYTDLAGAEAFTIDKMRILAKAQQATGASGADLAGMMHQLTNSMKIGDSDLENVMGGLINQAKDGSIEARQMSAEFGSILPIFARFGITGKQGVAEVGALFQTTRNGFDSASEAATGIIRLMAAFQRHAPRLAAQGINVFKPGSKRDLKDFGTIFKMIRESKLDKDIALLIKSLGRSEAWRTYEILRDKVEQTVKLQKAGNAEGVIQADLAQVLESSYGRLALATEHAKNNIAEAFTPERIEKFVQLIEGASTKIGPLAEGAGKMLDYWNGLMDVGKSIRGLLPGGDGHNPFQDELSDMGTARFDLSGKRVFTTGAQVRNTIAKRDAFEMAKSDIFGRERDEKTTRDSILKALEYTLMDPTGGGGKLGSIAAGDAYLRGAGITTKAKKERFLEDLNKEDPWTANAMRGRMQAVKAATAEGVKEGLSAIAPALAKLIDRVPEINLDGNKVSDGTKNATNKRARAR